MDTDPLRAAGWNLLHKAIAVSESTDLDEPHCIIAVEPVAHSITVRGPYPDGYAAQLAIPGLIAEIGEPLVCQIAPIYPPPE